MYSQKDAHALTMVALYMHIASHKTVPPPSLTSASHPMPQAHYAALSHNRHKGCKGHAELCHWCSHQRPTSTKSPPCKLGYNSPEMLLSTTYCRAKPHAKQEHDESCQRTGKQHSLTVRKKCHRQCMHQAVHWVACVKQCASASLQNPTCCLHWMCANQ
jgi:hypothetical protein